MTKISVIMPIYNDSENLEKSINSFLNQTLNDIELICVDDGSVDSSLKDLNNYAKKYNCIKVFHQENQGSGKARNLGMDKANGEYIGFLDADDYFIDDDALERLYNVAKKYNANFVTGNIKQGNETRGFKPFWALDYYTEDQVILPEEYGIPWSFYKNIYKTEFLRTNQIYFPDLIRGQDPVFLAEILSKVDKVYTVATDVYAYVYYSTAQKTKTYRKRFDQFMHYKCVFEMLDDSKFDKVRHAFRHRLFTYIDVMGTEGAEDTIKSLKEIFKNDPILLRECEDYTYFKYKNNDKIKDFVKLNKYNNPRVSIIFNPSNIIQKNKEDKVNYLKDIKKSINSIINQTLEDFELIVVNENLNEMCLEIIDNFEDERIKIIDINSENDYYKNIIKETNGFYVYFLENGKLSPDSLEKLYYNAISNGSDIVLSKYYNKFGYNVLKSEFIDQMKNIRFININYHHFSFDYSHLKQWLLNSSFNLEFKLFKKEFLNKLDYSKINNDIVIFNIESYIRSSELSYFDGNLGNYSVCINKHSLSRAENYLDNLIEFKEEWVVSKIIYYLNLLNNCNCERFFDLVKNELLNLDLNNLILKEELSEYINLVLKVNSFEDYRIKLIESENENIIKENKKLKKENKKLKRENKKILKSTSWKITKPLRFIKNRFKN